MFCVILICGKTKRYCSKVSDHKVSYILNTVSKLMFQAWLSGAYSPSMIGVFNVSRSRLSLHQLQSYSLTYKYPVDNRPTKLKVSHTVNSVISQHNIFIQLFYLSTDAGLLSPIPISRSMPPHCRHTLRFTKHRHFNLLYELFII